MSDEFEVQWIDDTGDVLDAVRLCAHDLAAAQAWAKRQLSSESAWGAVVERVEEDNQELHCEDADLNNDGVGKPRIGYGPGFRVGRDDDD